MLSSCDAVSAGQNHQGLDRSWMVQSCARLPDPSDEVVVSQSNKASSPPGVHWRDIFQQTCPRTSPMAEGASCRVTVCYSLVNRSRSVVRITHMQIRNEEKPHAYICIFLRGLAWNKLRIVGCPHQ